jgi:hypothetical protein
MRRWLAILLIVFLPLQFSWAAAAVYCQHESDAGTQHFGHHEHEHHADAEPDALPDSDLAGGIDHDCGPCHAGGVVALFADISLSLASGLSFVISRPPGALSSAASAVPERPNWFARA